jgi:hypothetical protein
MFCSQEGLSSRAQDPLMARNFRFSRFSFFLSAFLRLFSARFAAESSLMLMVSSLSLSEELSLLLDGERFLPCFFFLGLGSLLLSELSGGEELRFLFLFLARLSFLLSAFLAHFPSHVSCSTGKIRFYV